MESHSSRTDCRSKRTHTDIKRNHIYRASSIHAGLLAPWFVSLWEGLRGPTRRGGSGRIMSELNFQGAYRVSCRDNFEKPPNSFLGYRLLSQIQSMIQFLDGRITAHFRAIRQTSG